MKFSIVPINYFLFQKIVKIQNATINISFSDPPRVHLSLSTSLHSGQVAAVLTCDVDSSPPALVKILETSFINSIGCKLFQEVITTVIYFHRMVVHKFENLVLTNKTKTKVEIRVKTWATLS